MTYNFSMSGKGLKMSMLKKKKIVLLVTKLASPIAYPGLGFQSINCENCHLDSGPDNGNHE